LKRTNLKSCARVILGSDITYDIQSAEYVGRIEHAYRRSKSELLRRNTFPRSLPRYTGNEGCQLHNCGHRSPSSARGHVSSPTCESSRPPCSTSIMLSSPYYALIFAVPVLAVNWSKASLKHVNPLIGTTGPEPNLSGGMVASVGLAVVLDTIPPVMTPILF